MKSSSKCQSKPQMPTKVTKATARSGRLVRKGNLGHLTRIANNISHYGSMERDIEKYLKGKQCS